MKSWEDYDWTDIEPIYQTESDLALAPISYSKKYKKVTALLRALMEVNEHSERALAITAEVLDHNGAHYTAWDYRFDIVKDIGKEVYPYRTSGSVEPPVCEDMEWLNELTLQIPKNYQVWNYRQHLEWPGNTEFYRLEARAVQEILAGDSKNFHSWSHLIWVVKRSLETEAMTFNHVELRKFIETLLDEDIYNNSAWSFRLFVYNAFDLKDMDTELTFAESSIEFAPDNEAAWNYYSGFAAKFALGEETNARMEKFAANYPAEPRALELLAALTSNSEERRRLYSELSRLEPTRTNFWAFKLAMA